MLCFNWFIVGFPCNISLRWRHNGRDGVSNHQPHDCLLNRLFRRRSKKTPKLRVTGLCGGNSTGTGEFPAQMASNAQNVFIWWRHHVKIQYPWMNSTGARYSDELHRLRDMTGYQHSSPTEVCRSTWIIYNSILRVSAKDTIPMHDYPNAD